MQKIGLLTWNDTRVRGMRTRPSSLAELYPDKYEVVFFNDFNKRRKDFKNWISFPRNTWKFRDILSPIYARKNNVMIYDSNEFSQYNVFQNSISNGYYYARNNNMPWWWSFVTGREYNYLSTNQNTRIIGIYARTEHFNQKYYLEVFKMIEHYAIVFEHIEILLIGSTEDIQDFKERLLRFEIDTTNIQIVVEQSGTKFIQRLYSTRGEYWVIKLKGDCIPNLYFEAKYSGVVTRQINTGLFLSGVDEINTLMARPDIKEEIRLFLEGFHLITNKVFREKLFSIQEQHKIDFPIPSPETLVSSWEETLELIKTEGII